MSLESLAPARSHTQAFRILQELAFGAIISGSKDLRIHVQPTLSHPLRERGSTNDDTACTVTAVYTLPAPRDPLAVIDKSKPHWDPCFLRRYQARDDHGLPAFRTLIPTGFQIANNKHSRLLKPSLTVLDRDSVQIDPDWILYTLPDGFLPDPEDPCILAVQFVLHQIRDETRSDCLEHQLETLRETLPLALANFGSDRIPELSATVSNHCHHQSVPLPRETPYEPVGTGHRYALRDMLVQTRLHDAGSGHGEHGLLHFEGCTLPFPLPREEDTHDHVWTTVLHLDPYSDVPFLMPSAFHLPPSSVTRRLAIKHSPATEPALDDVRDTATVLLLHHMAATPECRPTHKQHADARRHLISLPDPVSRLHAWSPVPLDPQQRETAMHLSPDTNPLIAIPADALAVDCRIYGPSAVNLHCAAQQNGIASRLFHFRGEPGWSAQRLCVPTITTVDVTVQPTPTTKPIPLYEYDKNLSRTSASCRNPLPEPVHAIHVELTVTNHDTVHQFRMRLNTDIAFPPREYGDPRVPIITRNAKPEVNRLWQDLRLAYFEAGEKRLQHRQRSARIPVRPESPVPRQPHGSRRHSRLRHPCRHHPPKMGRSVTARRRPRGSHRQRRLRPRHRHPPRARAGLCSRLNANALHNYRKAPE